MQVGRIRSGRPMEQLDYAVQNGLVIATDNRSGAVVIPISHIVNWEVVPDETATGPFWLAAITADGVRHPIATRITSVSMGVAKLVELAGKAGRSESEERQHERSLSAWWVEH